MIKGLIFGLNGTLLEMTRPWDDIIREGAEAMTTWYLKKRHIKFDAEALIDAFITERYNASQTARASRTEVVAQDSLRRALTQVEAPTSTHAFVEGAIKVFFGPEEDAYRLDPHAITLLKQLKGEGYRLGLYANATDDKLLQRLINRHHLRPHLSPTFSSADFGWRKPKPEPFTMIAERWRLPPEQVVVVGSTMEFDILGAQRATMPSIFISHTNQVSEARPQPTAIIEQLTELPELLQRL